MTITASELASASRDRLDEVFRTSQPGPIPVGSTRGTALLAPGTPFHNGIKPLVRALVWMGKSFNPMTQDLMNVLSAIGFKGIRARVYQGMSWFDDKPAIIIDYSKTSFVARMVRDEIRQVSDGLYLGQIFLWKKRIGHFMLETNVLVSAGAVARAGTAAAEHDSAGAPSGVGPAADGAAAPAPAGGAQRPTPETKSGPRPGPAGIPPQPATASTSTKAP
jgi:hypothetical protein